MRASNATSATTAAGPPSCRHGRHDTPQLAIRKVLFVLLVAVTCLPTAGLSQTPPQATAGVVPGRPERYGGHEDHVGKKWLVQLNGDPGSYALQHWGCYDPSHAPHAIQPEGSIGMTSPGGGNWYHNGFFNFAVDGDQSRMYPVAAIRALDSGERASAEFLWDMPKAWVRVRFMVIPGQRPLFGAITQIPKAGAAPKLRVRLVAYPAGYFKDGGRVIVTPTRTLKTGDKVDLDPATEWSWIMYDEKRDLHVEGSVGGAGGLTVPDLVGTVKLDVGAYGVSWDLEAKGNELRFAFWGSQEQTNAELQTKLAAQFAPALADLRALDFTPLKLQPPGLAQLQAEFAKLFAETKGSEGSRKAYEALLGELQALRAQIGGGQVNLQAENGYLGVLDKLDQLLWKVRMDWIFAD